MKIIKYTPLVASIMAVSACNSVTLLPQTGDMQTTIANASTENEAIKLANDRARRTCALQSQNIKIIDLDTAYQGVDASQKTLISLAQKIMPKEKTSSPYTPDGYTYKATLTFKCL